MAHQGDYIFQYLKRSTKSIEDVAAILQVNRRSVYNYLHSEKLQDHVIYKIGKALDVDFWTLSPLIFGERPIEIRERKITEKSNKDKPGDYKDKYMAKMEELLEVKTKLYEVSAERDELRRQLELATRV